MKRDPLKTMLTNTYTKNGLLRRMRLLRSYLEHTLYTEGEGVTLEAYLAERNETDADVQAMKEWGMSIQKAFTKKTLYTKMDGLKQEVDELPTVIIFLPFIAKEKDVQKLSEWIRIHVKERSVIDLRFDPDAAGGCKVSYEGSFADYSASYYLRSHTNVFMDILRSYDSA